MLIAFSQDYFSFLVASAAIWKNMLEPARRKSRDWGEINTLACPTNDRPYISTLTNSQDESNS